MRSVSLILSLITSGALLVVATVGDDSRDAASGFVLSFAPEAGSPQQLAGALVMDVMRKNTNQDCSAMVKSSHCGDMLLCKNSDDINSLVPGSVVEPLDVNRKTRLQPAAMHFKRAALETFKLVCNHTVPQQHETCLLALKAVPSQEYAHMLKLQLEQRYESSGGGQSSVLLDQVVLADAMAESSQVTSSGEDMSLLVYLLIFVLVCVGVVAGTACFLAVVRRERAPGDARSIEMESLLPTRSLLPNFSKGRGSAMFGGAAKSRAGGGAASEEDPASALKRKLAQLREARAKELFNTAEAYSMFERGSSFAVPR
mmetsp:Transcript_17952/g.34313  ORF Transcript_17952/g.34313 Transcript_17952/m.34313 type:complete len:314 (-) Transcript_17952:356-1297(-)